MHTPQTPQHRFAGRARIALLLGLCLLVFAPVLFGGQTLFYRDMAGYQYWSEQLQHQTLPHVDAWHGGVETGVPWSAHPIYQVWFLVKWPFYLLLPWPLAMWATMASCVFLGGVGALRLVDRLTQRTSGEPSSGLGGLAAGIAVICSGLLLGTHHMFNLYYSVALSFVFLDFVVAVATRPTPLKQAGMAFWGLMVLVCSFQIFVLLQTFALAALLCLPGRLWERRRLLALARSYALVAVLALPVVLPTMTLVRHSNRSAALSVEEITERSLPPQRLAELAMPRPFGPVDDYSGPRFRDQEGLLTDIYLGAPVLLLAVWGLFGRRKGILGLGLLTGIFGVLALGEATLLFSAWLQLPFFGRFRFPEKLLCLVAIGVPILAGLGAAQAAKSGPRAGRTTLTLALATALAGSGALWAAFADASSAWRQASCYTLGVWAALLAGACVRRRWFLPLCLLACLADGLIHGRPALLPSEHNPFQQTSAVAEALQPMAEDGPIRILCAVDPALDPMPAHYPAELAPYFAAVDMLANASPLGFGIEAFDFSTSLLDRSYNELVQAMWADPVLRYRVLRALDVRFLVVHPSDARLENREFKILVRTPAWVLIEDTFCPPRLRLAQQVMPAASLQEALQTMAAPSFDLQQAIVVEGIAEPASCGPGRILSSDYGRQLIEIELDMEAPGWLFVADKHYPYWRAEIDAQPVPIHRAMGLGRAVQVPAGRHTLRFRYVDEALQLGLLLQACLLTAALAGWLLWRRHQQRVVAAGRGSHDGETSPGSPAQPAD